MILSRLSRAIRQQNWFAVALEFVIVIARLGPVRLNALLSDRASRRQFLIRPCPALPFDLMQNGAAPRAFGTFNSFRAPATGTGDQAQRHRPL